MRSLKYIFLPVLSLALFVTPAFPQNATNQNTLAQQPAALTNDDIIALAGAGLSDDVIAAKIRKAPSAAFDTSVAGLKALRAAGVSSAVIRVMVDPAVPVAPASSTFGSAASALSDPDDPNSPHLGIYIQLKGDDGKPHLTKLIMNTISDTKTPGLGDTLASAYSFGFHRAKFKNTVAGSKAQTETRNPNPTFYDYAGDMSIQSLALIKFEVKGDTRTVTSASAAGSIGGLVNGMSKSGPSDKEQQAFTSELVKPGVYKLTLTKPLEPGAYAFVNGAYYDFDILPPQ